MTRMDQCTTPTAVEIPLYGDDVQIIDRACAMHASVCGAGGKAYRDESLLSIFEVFCDFYQRITEASEDAEAAFVASARMMAETVLDPADRPNTPTETITIYVSEAEAAWVLESFRLYVGLANAIRSGARKAVEQQHEEGAAEAMLSGVPWVNPAVGICRVYLLFSESRELSRFAGDGWIDSAIQVWQSVSARTSNRSMGGESTAAPVQPPQEATLEQQTQIVGDALQRIKVDALLILETLQNSAHHQRSRIVGLVHEIKALMTRAWIPLNQLQTKRFDSLGGAKFHRRRGGRH